MTGSRTIYILVYIDDMVITGSDQDQIQQPMNAIKAEFKVHDLGALSYFLGVQVRKRNKYLFLDQEHYLTNLLHSTDLDNPVLPDPAWKLSSIV